MEPGRGAEQEPRQRRSRTDAMSISEPFIRRPVATSLLMIGVLLAGLAGYRELAVSALPQVDYPTIVVSTSLPGASAETMSQAVTTPLERQFGQMPALSQMTSVSSFCHLADHAAVQPRSQHRRGGTRRPGGDQRRGEPCRARLPAPPTYSKATPPTRRC